ncbi:Exocyst complex component sec6 [Neolecta irregularis DAH-3]|uniref:Exocyst complex component sec6 n=1 Tax=Neolecta irregularis (strain DAH-3) TaxID=1198029 RepID=A0A1U7LQ98_NEOID|nr:Exocyst complex component sec6 [Neolecta irregularis DAH-3]|eukprot:OLL24798.1 Exocyst complex component sec6 [Neolecta irregularis DAH-3]
MNREYSSLSVQRVGELLRQPDDLDKIGLLKARFLREKVAVEAQLKAGVKTQLDTTQSGLDELDGSHKHLLAIREEMMKIDKLCAESQLMVKDFPLIRRISKIHRNFAAVQDMVTQLEEMHTNLDTVQALLIEDDDDEELKMSNLLAIHFIISRLQGFQNDARQQALKTDESIQKTLDRYFERLDEMTDIFHDKLWKICLYILDLIRDNNTSLVVRIAKIIDVEERNDEKALALQDARSNHRELASKFSVVQSVTRLVRHYKQKFFEAINTSICTKFVDQANGGGHSVLLDNYDWIFDDLTLVRDRLTHLVPSTWNIVDEYVKFYHTNVYNILNALLAAEPDAATNLRILEWTKMYYSTMTKEIRIPKSQLEPKLLDGKESQLMDDYLQLIVSKVEEWMSNLAVSATKEFTARTEPPEIDGDNLYGMQGAVIMFQMISQQIDVALDSGQGKILASVVHESVSAMKKRQEGWQTLLLSEVEKQIETPQEIPPGLVEYIIALANDQIRNADYTEAISTRLGPLVSQKYATPITESLSGAIDGFLDLAKDCVSVLIRLVFNDLKVPFSSIFTSTWHGGNDMTLVVSTFQEYLVDFNAHLNETLSEILIEDLLQMFLVNYVTAIHNKGAKFTIPQGLEQIREDVRQAFLFFVDYIPSENLQYHFEIVESILTLLSVPKEGFFVNFDRLTEKYWDTPVWIMEDLLKIREDLDKGGRKDLLEYVRRRRKDLDQVAREETIMARLVKT